jgi:uncharacterized protein YjiS (DUF1127 family)
MIMRNLLLRHGHAPTESLPHVGAHAGIVDAMARLVVRLRAGLLARRQRRALMALDDRMLADIGLSRTDAYREASRPLFDLPARHS